MGTAAHNSNILAAGAAEKFQTGVQLGQGSASKGRGLGCDLLLEHLVRGLGSSLTLPPPPPPKKVSLTQQQPFKTCEELT